MTEALASRIELHGVEFDPLLEADVVAGVLSGLTRGDGGWISTPNSHHLRECERSPSLRGLLGRASYVVADGMPLIWASRLQGTPLPGRVPGSDLVWSLARGAARDGRTVFLLGGDEGVAPRAKERLEREIPGIRVVGFYCPPLGFETDLEEQERIEELLAACRPDIVYVGLGFPKQERLILELGRVLAETWFLGIGISLSFISEDRARAPRWMQVGGLEWIHRLWHEPRRLFRRYVTEGIPFAVRLFTGAAAVRALTTCRISRRRGTDVHSPRRDPSMASKPD